MKNNMRPADMKRINTPALAEAFINEQVEAVRAQVGDKTMMDALYPAVTAMQECASDDIIAVLKAGAEAAQKGAEATVQMKANFGRARNYGEKSVGHADSGASSWACMFESFAQAL